MASNGKQSDRPHVGDRLTQHIRAQIVSGVWPPGTALPSVRGLAAKFGISYGSVRNVLSQLVREGVLESLYPHGVYVSSPTGHQLRCRRRNRIAVLIPPWREPTGIYDTVLQRICERAEAYQHKIVRFQHDRELPITPEVVEWINANCCVCILLCEVDHLAISRLALTIPTIGVMIGRDFRSQLSLVDLDPFNAAELAVDFFRQRGHRKLRVVSISTPAYRNRATVAEEYWRHTGGELLPRLLLSYDKGQLHLPSPLEPGTGYLFTSDSLLYDAYVSSRDDFGRDLLELDVLGMDGKSLRMRDKWKICFPTIALDWNMVGEQVFSEAMFAVESPGYRTRRIYLPGTLYVEQGLDSERQSLKQKEKRI